MTINRYFDFDVEPTKTNRQNNRTDAFLLIFRQVTRSTIYYVYYMIYFYEEDFDDVGCNADLYASRQDAFQGSSRGSDERSQQQSDPHCFQSLSLD